MKELREMQHLIARKLINNPSFNNRDFEQFGYTLIENHVTKVMMKTKLLNRFIITKKKSEQMLGLLNY